jgi:Lrp/AsnC family leucine-responsive transcriptional regulator
LIADSRIGSVMDRYDRIIVSQLVANSRATAAEIAGVAHLSRSAVTRRIQALEDKGTLCGYHALLSNERLGWSMQALITLRAPSFEHKRVIKEVLEFPEVLTLRILSGNSHFLIEGVFLNTSHMRDFLREIQSYGETETHVVFDYHRSKKTFLERLEHFEKWRETPDEAVEPS